SAFRMQITTSSIPPCKNRMRSGIRLLFSFVVLEFELLKRLTPVGGPQDVGQLTVATGSRDLRLASLKRPSSLLAYPAAVARFSGHKSTQRRGKDRHSAGSPYACRILTAILAFSISSCNDLLLGS